jgi:hypothetical protein
MAAPFPPEARAFSNLAQALEIEAPPADRRIATLGIGPSIAPSAPLDEPLQKDDACVTKELDGCVIF